MTTQSPFSAVPTSEYKRRKVEVESTPGSGQLQLKTDRPKVGATDRAKANYLSGQLRLRLQYAKLKVEHGWQRQSLSEVENLYFRHTHLTRPYPVISPGGRRNGRTLSTASSFAQQENVLSGSPTKRDLTSNGASHPMLTSTPSSSFSAAESFYMPSTPTLVPSHTSTPLAPHLGFGNGTRYPLSRSDSTATLILDAAPSLHPFTSSHPHQQTHVTSALRASGSGSGSGSSFSLSSSSSQVIPPASTSTSTHAQAFREPFDPMEPTDHLDSQLAALRSIISASALPIPLPPPASASGSAPTPTSLPVPPLTLPASSALPSATASHPSQAALGGTGTGSSAGAGASAGAGGLTYDAFWSAHGSAGYRSLLAGGSSSGGGGAPRAVNGRAPLQAHASAPAILAVGTSTSPAAAASKANGAGGVR